MRHSDPAVLELGMRPDFEVPCIAGNLLLERVLKEGGTVYQTSAGGYTDKKLQDLFPIFESRGGKRFYEWIYGKEDRGTVSNTIFAWENGMAELTTAENGHITFLVLSLDQELVTAIRDDIDPVLNEPLQQGYVFAITRPGGGVLQITRMGYAGIPLVRGNYSKRVIEDYDFVVRDLRTPSPSGRIAILEGPPGTGKSFLIRSLLMEVPDAMFVLVPPSMVASLGGPDLLPLLLQNKESWSKKGPVILILEDADECLVPRRGDNMESISSLLNMGDGIFGSLFDVRIIATTNAKRAEMDGAILRAGRLSKRIEVGTMNYEDAERIFTRLVPNGPTSWAYASMSLVTQEDKELSMKPRSSKKTTFTLAEIYKAAREAGWEPKPTKSDDPNSSPTAATVVAY